MARTAGRSKAAPKTKPSKAAKPKPRRAPARRTPSRSSSTANPKAAQTSGGITYDTVTPMLVLDGASDAIAWYTKAFGAKELSRQPLPDGRLMHAAIRIGTSTLMLCDPFNGPVPETLTGATMHIQDAGVDKMWERAVAGGAKVRMPLANQFWGDRYGQLVDPWGQSWSLGRAVQISDAEKRRLQQEAMAMMAGPAS